MLFECTVPGKYLSSATKTGSSEHCLPCLTRPAFGVVTEQQTNFSFICIAGMICIGRDHSLTATR